MSEYSNLRGSRKEAREAGEKYYFTGKPCKYGHIDKRLSKSCHCFSCLRVNSNKYYAKYPERVKETNRRSMEKNGNWNKENYRKNRVEILLKQKLYYIENREKILKRNKKWRDENRDSESRRKNKWRSTSEGKVVSIMRGMLHRKINRKSYDGRTHEILGYTHIELRDHIQKQFTDGMNWDNYGEKWHIDHIIPIKHFLDKGIKDPKIVNALSNLRPLCAVENVRKSDKIEFLI